MLALPTRMSKKNRSVLEARGIADSRVKSLAFGFQVFPSMLLKD
jgi:hypothetical protein